MKPLNMTPLKYDIELWEYQDAAEGCSMVNFKLAETSGQICLNAKEAERIGKWFVSLAKELSAK